MDNLIPVSPQGNLPLRLSPRAHNGELAALWRIYGGEPFHLLRTQEGRGLSRARYRRAQEFQRLLEPGAPGDWTDFLYFTGIVVQLALSSHLLDVGFSDAWCARHIGLHVDRSLAYANASGFGRKCDETERLAQVLSPYWKWNCRHLIDGTRPDDGGFTPDDVRSLLHELLEHVGQVTGHGRSLRRKWS
ncbi:hypothetical protein KRR38_32850 [Novosphingobium sp. G106]|uniref:hypothetical protein n=1 Tax=Novosphingobium sp. G106 TaxID=2849500 RepID=UPI001C2DA39D|nr:hypothetical protein [Novosphingobium sp. G106]MBV1692320.1 hypothetical protein [Novosphingobium sp. G106]